jgi:flagellar basal body rod protein FlgB
LTFKKKEESQAYVDVVAYTYNPNTSRLRQEDLEFQETLSQKKRNRRKKEERRRRTSSTTTTQMQSVSPENSSKQGRNIKLVTKSSIEQKIIENVLVFKNQCNHDGKN